MNEARRKFLRISVCGLTGAAMVASLDRLSLVNAMVHQQQTEAASDYKHSSQTRILLLLTPAAFLMLFTRTFRLRRTMWARLKALWIFGVQANSRSCAMLVRWFNLLRAPITRRVSDARINSFHIRTRLPSSKRLSPIRWARRVGEVALLTRPIR